MRKALRIVAVNVLLCVLAAALALGAVELRTRLTWTPPLVSHAQRYAEDDRLNHVFSPGYQETLNVHPEVPPYVFRTNELGLRFDRPYSIAKPPRTKRIVFCGDSFVEGYEYSRGVVALTEQALKPQVEQHGEALEVIHAGVGTYSPTIHFFALKYKLLDLDPDLVIIAVDMTDAWDDSVRYGPLVTYDGREPAGVLGTISGRKESLRQGMIRELPMTNRDFWIAYGAGSLYYARKIFDERAMDYTVTYEKLIDYFLPNHGFARALFDARDPQNQKWREASFPWLRRTKELLDARGAPLVVAVYPYQVQLRDEQLREIFRVYEAETTRLGALFHDASPEFLAEENQDGLFLTGDTHYNYRGQAVWAKSLSSFLGSKLEGLWYAGQDGKASPSGP